MEKNDTFKTIGERIAGVRKSAKNTQEELADILECTPKHISHVENNTSNLSLANLIQFCMHYGCSLDYIVFGHANNAILSQLPEGILTILGTGTKEELDRLYRYLNIYLEINNKQE